MLTLDLFKSRLNNFWMSKDVKYDKAYTVNLAAAWDLPAALAVKRQHS